ncbi:uncharacterized protein V1516DRAFT_354881 [Lipomyces oligophaga]|uniref:uncharacterized protein n=1 Tax=Lipomyces oligophaga TaxID=45792 RepID=UPI0034CE9193
MPPPAQQHSLLQASPQLPQIEHLAPLSVPPIFRPDSELAHTSATASSTHSYGALQNHHHHQQSQQSQHHPLPHPPSNSTGSRSNRAIASVIPPRPSSPISDTPPPVPPHHSARRLRNASYNSAVAAQGLLLRTSDTVSAPPGPTLPPLINSSSALKDPVPALTVKTSSTVNHSQLPSHAQQIAIATPPELPGFNLSSSPASTNGTADYSTPSSDSPSSLNSASSTSYFNYPANPPAGRQVHRRNLFVPLVTAASAGIEVPPPPRSTSRPSRNNGDTSLARYEIEYNLVHNQAFPNDQFQRPTSSSSSSTSSNSTQTRSIINQYALPPLPLYATRTRSSSNASRKQHTVITPVDSASTPTPPDSRRSSIVGKGDRPALRGSRSSPALKSKYNQQNEEYLSSVSMRTTVSSDPSSTASASGASGPPSDPVSGYGSSSEGASDYSSSSGSHLNLKKQKSLTKLRQMTRRAIAPALGNRFGSNRSVSSPLYSTSSTLSSTPSTSSKPPPNHPDVVPPLPSLDPVPPLPDHFLQDDLMAALSLKPSSMSSESDKAFHRDYTMLSQSRPYSGLIEEPIFPLTTRLPETRIPSVSNNSSSNRRSLQPNRSSGIMDEDVFYTSRTQVVRMSIIGQPDQYRSVSTPVGSAGIPMVDTAFTVAAREDRKTELDPNCPLPSLPGVRAQNGRRSQIFDAHEHSNGHFHVHVSPDLNGSETSYSNFQRPHEATDQRRDPSRITSMSSVNTRNSTISHATTAASSMTEEESKRLYRRIRLIRELLETEEGYVNDLKVLDKFYRLSAIGQGLFSKDDFALIFGNLPSTLEFAIQFCEALKIAGQSAYTESRQVSDYSDSVLEEQESFVGETFVQAISNMEAVYLAYCKSYERAIYRLRRLSNSNSNGTYQRWQEACIRASMQRLTKYPLLLSSLAELTPDEHPDKRSLNNATAQITSCAERINRGTKKDPKQRSSLHLSAGDLDLKDNVTALLSASTLSTKKTLNRSSEKQKLAMNLEFCCFFFKNLYE